jgi:predicted restriction endonuclease
VSPLKPCLEPGCPRLSPTGPRCPEHAAAHKLARSRERSQWSPSRNRSAQRKFRAAVLERASHRCQFVLANGARCNATEGLHAHHLVPLHKAESYAPENGIALCRLHHRSVDSHAR